MSNFSLVILSITIFYVFDVSESTANTNANTRFENRDFKPEAFDKAVKLTKTYPYFYRKNVEDIVFICPAEQNFSQDRCFHIKQKPSESRPVICKEKFKPTLVKLFSCGDGGTWYSFQYKICNPTKKSHIDDVAPIEEEKSTSDEFDFDADDEKSEQQPETTAKQETDLISIIESKQSHVIEVYAFCYNKNIKQTLFTRHTMSTHVPWIESSQMLEELRNIEVKTLKEGDYQDFDDDLTFMSDIYDQDKQKDKFKELFKNELISKDDFYLVPQMLTPKIDISTTLFRGVHELFVNIRPIWKSRFDRWNLIRRFVWNRKTLTNEDLIFTIYNGTYGSMKVNGKRIYLHKETVTIPRIWWMLVMEEKSRTGIIIAMNNDIGSSEKKLCEKDICKGNGWDAINSENMEGYCCKVTQTRLEGLGLSFLKVPVDIFNYEKIMKEGTKKKER